MTRAETAAAEAAMAAPQICGKYNEGKKEKLFSLLRLSFHHRSIRVVSPSFCIFFQRLQATGVKVYYYCRKEKMQKFTISAVLAPVSVVAVVCDVCLSVCLPVRIIKCSAVKEQKKNKKTDIDRHKEREKEQ